MKEYERPPRSDWGATLFVIVIVFIAFAVVTAVTDEPEEAAIEAMGQVVYQIKTDI